MLFNLMKEIGGAKNNFLVRQSPLINVWRYAAELCTLVTGLSDRYLEFGLLELQHLF